MRPASVLSFLSLGIYTRIHQDGEGTESVPEPDEDIRGMRPAYVLLEK